MTRQNGEAATLASISLDADSLDPREAAAIYKTHGCLVVRQLQRDYWRAVYDDIETVYQESIGLLDQARAVPEGWVTPNGALFLPAPAGFVRDKQIMTLPMNYRRSAAFFRSAFEPRTVDLLTAILGPDVELFQNGQSLYKEPVGGHPKHLHQDAAYFEHRDEGPVATLNYVVPTNLDNGCLHVVPGSHRLGLLEHTDTFSHLGLDAGEWPWEAAVPIPGEPGDSIFFNVKCIHGSQENHSTGPRPVYIHRYRRCGDVIVAGGTSTDNRGARADHEPGFMVAGLRRHVEPVV